MAKDNDNDAPDQTPAEMMAEEVATLPVALQEVHDVSFTASKSAGSAIKRIAKALKAAKEAGETEAAALDAISMANRHARIHGLPSVSAGTVSKAKKLAGFEMRTQAPRTPNVKGADGAGAPTAGGGSDHADATGGPSPAITVPKGASVNDAASRVMSILMAAGLSPESIREVAKVITDKANAEARKRDADRQRAAA